MATADLMLSPAQLTGRQPPPLCEVQPGFALHCHCVAAFQAMAAAAATEGILITIASSWRDFARQQQIVSAKLNGQRALYDLAGQVLQPAPTDRSALLDAVLLYSALPGASRHHWGTDFDVYDKAAVAADYQLQLQAGEYADYGPFAALSQWLEQHAASYGFFRPYRCYQNGVAPEPWHLSYRPLASQYLQDLTLEVLRDALQQSQLPYLAQILTRLPELYQRFVTNICE